MNGDGPYRLSSMHHKQASLGAAFVKDEFDWVRAARFTEPTEEMNAVRRWVGVHDVSFMTKLSAKMNNAPEAVTRFYKLPSPVQVGTVALDEVVPQGRSVCAVVADDEALFLCKPIRSQELRRMLSEDSQISPRLVDVTSVFTGIYLVGANSRKVLAKLTELNVNQDEFPNERVAYADIQHVQCFVIHRDVAATPAYLIFFERSFGEYIWDVVFRAGEEFHIIPAGVEAMEMLGWR
jgi:sarcosine oxidase subunit alpha